MPRATARGVWPDASETPGPHHIEQLIADISLLLEEKVRFPPFSNPKNSLISDSYRFSSLRSPQEESQSLGSKLRTQKGVL